ncbi:unnamed protein product [Penicillium salamii]|nr:unnamed protein product [Penicillium salamii]
MEPEPEVAGAASHSESNPESTPALDTETDTQSTTSTTSRPLSGVIPPYWRRHDRNVSHASQSSLRGITLEDHTADPDSETTRGLWARSVAIEDHVVVRGMTGVGSYVVWNCTIQTLDVGDLMWCFRARNANNMAGWSNCGSDEVGRNRVVS